MIFKFFLFYFVVIISVTPEHNIKLTSAQSVLNRFANTFISAPNQQNQATSNYRPVLNLLNPFSNEPINDYTEQGRGISKRDGQSYRSNLHREIRTNVQSRSNLQPTVCAGYWSYQHDKNNGNSGLLTIPKPSHTQNDVRITLSLPVRLHLSVSLGFLFNRVLLF